MERRHEQDEQAKRREHRPLNLPDPTTHPRHALQQRDEARELEHDEGDVDHEGSIP